MADVQPKAPKKGYIATYQSLQGSLEAVILFREQKERWEKRGRERASRMRAIKGQ